MSASKLRRVVTAVLVMLGLGLVLTACNPERANDNYRRVLGAAGVAVSTCTGADTLPTGPNTSGTVNCSTTGGRVTCTTRNSSQTTDLRAFSSCKRPNGRYVDLTWYGNPDQVRWERYDTNRSGWVTL